ncbi:MAG: hypothetical protein GX811_04525 [Lentisphaerae bacterium]|nr:hypothetical protein [Lentisphaerota bacterium]
MGFFDFFRRKDVLPELPNPQDTVCVADIASFQEAPNAKKGVRVTPRDNFNALKNIAVFAEREEIKIIAVVTGRELQEVENGKDYRGVTTFYCETPEDAQKKVLQMAGKYAKKQPVILTGDPDLEQMALAKGFSCMRPSTFKKSGSPERREPQPQRRKQNPNARKRTGERPKKRPDITVQEQEDTGILSLIDPV